MMEKRIAVLATRLDPERGLKQYYCLYRLCAIPRFAGQPLSGVFGPDLETTMSVVGIVHNEIYSAGLVGYPSNKVELHMRYVGCSADFLSLHISY